MVPGVINAGTTQPGEADPIDTVPAWSVTPLLGTGPALPAEDEGSLDLDSSRHSDVSASSAFTAAACTHGDVLLDDPPVELSLTGRSAGTVFLGGSPTLHDPLEGGASSVPLFLRTGTIQPGPADPNFPTSAWLVRPL